MLKHHPEFKINTRKNLITLVMLMQKPSVSLPNRQMSEGPREPHRQGAQISGSPQGQMTPNGLHEHFKAKPTK